MSPHASRQTPPARLETPDNMSSSHDIIRPVLKKRRISNSAEEMQSTIAAPGSIKINVTGAFIIDHHEEDHTSPSRGSPIRSNTSSPTSDVEMNDSSQPRHHQRDIRLPNHTSVVSHVAADIGGSLAKVVYFTRENAANPQSGGRLNFLSFETDKIDDCISYLRVLQTRYQESLQTLSQSTTTTSSASLTSKSSSPSSPPKDLTIQATGGGAFKFYDQIQQQLGLSVHREDEMECLIKGLDFFITEIPMEVFTYDDTNPLDAVHFQDVTSTPADVYPYLLVNIGSGVSMIKVSGPSQFQRIGGTSLGGGTLWGLLSLLTGARNFDDMLAMADKGENGNVDLLVGDIYGEGIGYEKIGLKEKHIASSFGKVLKRKREAERCAEDGGGLSNGDLGEEGEREKANGGLLNGEDHSRLVGDGRMFRPEDISRSLLYAISNNLGQIAFLQSEKHDLKRIYFGGSFIRGHQQTIHTLSYAIKFWSKGLKQAYFLRHEGYLGAVGAFLKRRPVSWTRRGSTENIETVAA